MNHPSHRHRVAAALAIPIIAASPAMIAAPVAAEDPVPLDCTTAALTQEEIEAGVTSSVTCEPRPEGDVPRAAADGSPTLAVHYQGTGGTGDSLTVTGSVCDGAGIAFAAASPWNNEIRSTRNGACANAKHFSNPDYTGTNQTAAGSFGTLTNIGSPLNAQVSSVGYGT